MTIATYSFSDEAIADLDTICESMSETNTDFAIRFFEKVREKCRNLLGFRIWEKADCLTEVGESQEARGHERRG
jgi:hypothetical protein